MNIRVPQYARKFLSSCITGDWREGFSSMELASKHEAQFILRKPSSYIKYSKKYPFTFQNYPWSYSTHAQNIERLIGSID
jgi:hypothetical protein